MTNCIARRYARALFELIEENASLHQPLVDLTEVARNDELSALLANPAIPASIKESVLLAVVTELPEELKRLLSILSSRNKLSLLARIGEQVEAMIQANAAAVDVELIVATRISAALRNKIAAALEGTIGKKLNFKVHQHKAIVGGFIVNIGDRRIDHSLYSRLNGMRMALTS